MNGDAIRSCAIWLLACVPAATWAASKPPAGAEESLRARVDQFYKLIREKKYRAAEELVAPESRDQYYAEEKPAIEDFKIESIAWDDNFTKANLTMASTMKLRTARLGEYPQQVPYLSHWILQNGQWMWYIPKVTARQTPFGTMHVNPNSPGAKDVDLKDLIAKGPTEKDLALAIVADRSHLELKNGAHQEIKLKSSLPGPVKLKAQIISGSGFEAFLKSSDLEPHGKTELIVSRLQGTEFRAGRVSVLVIPTEQVIEISVN